MLHFGRICPPFSKNFKLRPSRSRSSDLRLYRDFFKGISPLTLLSGKIPKIELERLPKATDSDLHFFLKFFRKCKPSFLERVTCRVLDPAKLVGASGNIRETSMETTQLNLFTIWKFVNVSDLSRWRHGAPHGRLRICFFALRAKKQILSCWRSYLT